MLIIEITYPYFGVGKELCFNCVSEGVCCLIRHLLTGTADTRNAYCLDGHLHGFACARVCSLNIGLAVICVDTKRTCGLGRLGICY